MGQLVLGIVGGIIGSFFGMPQLGFLLGSLVGSLLFPVSGPSGPRLANLQVTSSAYGQFIPIGFGTARIGGNIIWAKNLIEKSQSSGGKKGGGKTYTYYFTGAIALCDTIGTDGIVDITRAWADTKLVYDKTGASTASQTALLTGAQGGSKKKGTKDGNGNEITQFSAHWKLYKGTEDQMPDPLIEADKGVGNVSAMRGMAYIVLNEFPLADFGSRIPNFTFEVVFSGTPTVPHQGLPLTFMTGGPLDGGYQFNSLCVDWDKDRFFFSQAGTSSGKGIYACRISDMVNYDQRSAADACIQLPTGTITVNSQRGNQLCPGNGYIYTGSGGGNSDPILQIDEDSLTVVGKFGNGGSGLDNTGTSFVSSTQLTPLLFFDTAVPGFDILATTFTNHFGILTDGLKYQAGALSGLTLHSSIAVPSFSNAVSFIYSYNDTQFNLYEAVISDYIVGLARVMVPSDFDDAWTEWGEFGPSLSHVYLDQNDGCHIFSLVGGGPIVVNWGAPDYTGAASWDATKEYSKGDGVKSGSNYYVSIADNNINNAVGSNGSWQHLSDPSDPTLEHTKIAKYDPVNFEVVWCNALSNASNAPPKATSGIHTRINNGLFAWVVDGAVAYCDTTTGDIEYETDWRVGVNTLNPEGSQAFDGTRNVIIYQDVDHGWTKLQLGGGAAGQDTVAGVVTALCARVGLTPDDLDVTDVEDDVVHGYIVNNQGSVRDDIGPLALSFFFDAVESDDKLKFVKRGNSPVVTIPQSDLIPPSSNDGFDSTVFAETRTQELELPRVVNVTYMDKDNGYQQGQQSSPRVSLPVPTMFSQNSIDAQLPLSMSGSEAKQIAEKTLWASWLARTSGKFSVGPKYLAYEPTDVVTVELDNGASYILRLSEANVGADYSLEMTGASERPTAYVSNAVGGAPQGIPQQVLDSATVLRSIIFDSPYLTDTEVVDTVATMHACGGRYDQGTWPGEVIFKSDDGTNWSNAATLTEGSIWGSVLVPINDCANPFATDYTSTMKVTFFQGADEIDNATYDAVLNNANMGAIVNMISGQVEIINFMNRTVNADGTITFDGFLRGRRGTDTMCNGHQTGDLFVVLRSDSTAQVPLAIAETKKTVYFKGVGGSMSFAFTPSITTKPDGRSLMPYSVVNQKAAWSGGAINLSWTRRTRYNGEMIDGSDIVPLNEATEAYEIDIYDGDNIVRTLVVDNGATPVTTPGVTYTAQMIADDFGAQPTSIKFAVYQMSASVGRGFGGPVELTPTGTATPTTRYYGVLTTTTPVAADITALSNTDLEPDFDLTFSYDATGGAYPTFAYPNGYGVPTHVKVNGLPFSDFASSTLSIGGATYRVLRFNLLQHGAAISVVWG